MPLNGKWTDRHLTLTRIKTQSANCAWKKTNQTKQYSTVAGRDSIRLLVKLKILLKCIHTLTKHLLHFFSLSLNSLYMYIYIYIYIYIYNIAIN